MNLFTLFFVDIRTEISWKLFTDENISLYFVVMHVIVTVNFSVLSPAV